MEHTANYVDGVFGRVKVFVKLYCSTIAVLDLNIIPGVDVNFLNPCPEDVFSEK